MAVGLFACGGDDSSPSGAGAAAGAGRGGTSGSSGSAGRGGTSGSSGSAGSGGAGGATQTGGSGGGSGSAGTSGSAGKGGAAGVDGGAGSGGAAGSGKGGTGGAAGIDGSAGAGGAVDAGKGGASGAGGTTLPDGASGAGGNGGSQSDAGLDASRDAERDVIDAAADAPIQGPADFHCVNWADPRDNFVNGNLELSGLVSATDTYATVQTKANAILSEFQTKLKADSIRIPINEPTVSGAWWAAYKGAIDAAVAKGMKVVIAYWAYQNGRPADATAFKNMWQVVVNAYQSNNLVYFDIHNEPYGYAGNAWNDAAAQWLTDFPGVPKGRVIVAGTGYDDNVNSVGADPRFAGCILQLHIYGFWHTDWTAKKQWTDSMTSALGPYAARTLVGEWGAQMTTGVDYTNTADGDAYRSYVLAVSDVMHDAGMGSCYWPGLRNGDSYSMTKLNSGTPLTLTVNSVSGLARLHWAWGLP